MPPPFPSPCWPRYLNASAAHEDIPARSLTWTEASEVIAYAVGNGWMVVDPQIRFGPSCEVILTPTNADRITLGSNVLAGVAVRERQSRHQPPSSRATITNISPRLAVMTFRMARSLAASWGVTEIWHMGMGQGRGPAGDPHNSGRAMDFSGAQTRSGPFFVSRDWGNAPVWEHGHRMDQWPQTETHTQFRLERPGQPLTPAARFFLDVYTFFTQQASDAPGGRARPAHIGDAGYIIHPDYPSHGSTPSSGRHAHLEHVHAEVPPVSPAP